MIFRDAAGSTEKQIQDIESLMKCGIDLLIVSPDGSNALNGIMEEVFRGNSYCGCRSEAADKGLYNGDTGR